MTISTAALAQPTAVTTSTTWNGRTPTSRAPTAIEAVVGTELTIS